MRARLLLLVTLTLSAACLAFALPRTGDSPPLDALAQSSTSPLAAYDIDILSAVTGGTLRMTSGWHGDRYGGAAIDIAAWRGDLVHARFNVNKTHAGISAVVSEVHDDDSDCRRMAIFIKEKQPGSDQVRTIGKLHYYHVKPLIGLDLNTGKNVYLKPGDKIAIGAGESPTKLGEIINSELEPRKCTTGDHLHMSAGVAGDADMWRNADRTYLKNDDGMGFDPASAAFSSTKEGYGVPDTWFCDDTWMFKLYPDSYTGKTVAEWAPRASVIAKCRAPGAPGNPGAASTDKTITLTWDDPGDAGITGYMYRIRKADGEFPDGEGSVTILEGDEEIEGDEDWRGSCTNTPETTADEAPSWVADINAWDSWGYGNETKEETKADAARWITSHCDWTPIPESDDTTTSYTISTGLEADTNYVVQVRARDGDHLSDRGGIATLEIATAAICTVNVAIQDAEGNALSVDGVDVTGRGEGGCGTRTLMVDLTNADYDFTSWTVAAATGLTFNCAAGSTTCTVTFGTEAGSADTAEVTATFTRKQCTVTGDVTTIDHAGNTLANTVGGTVEANDSETNSARVPCGDNVTLTHEAKTGFTFKSWGDDCTSVSEDKATCTVETSVDDQAVTVTATFQKDPPTTPDPPTPEPPTPEPPEEPEEPETKQCTDPVATVPVDQDCPPKQCTDPVAEVPNGGTCPVKQCTDPVAEVPNGGTCPVKQCTDPVAEVPNGGTCPVKQCTDPVAEVPNGGTCPVKTCTDPVAEVPNGGMCPVKTCTDPVAEVPNGGMCPVKTCPDGSSVPNGGTCPTYNWTGVCTLTGSVGGGGPFSTPGAAQLDGNRWGAACPTTDLSTGIWKTTNYYATITCTNGTTFTVGPSTETGIITLAQGALLACAASGGAAGLSGRDVDRTTLIEALRTVLSEEAIKAGAAGLIPVDGATGNAEEASEEEDREGFTTSLVDNQHHVAVTCRSGLSFTIRPAATLEQALDDGAYGLLVCANSNLLSGLSLPESLTRVQLEELVQTALSALPTPVAGSALKMPPSRVQHQRVTKQSGTYSVYSVDTWHWSASCTSSNNTAVSGGGSANTQADASAAVLSWVNTANCKVGTYLVTVASSAD